MHQAGAKWQPSLQGKQGCRVRNRKGRAKQRSKRRLEDILTVGCLSLGSPKGAIHGRGFSGEGS